MSNKTNTPSATEIVIVRLSGGPIAHSEFSKKEKATLKRLSKAMSTRQAYTLRDGDTWKLTDDGVTAFEDICKAKAEEQQNRKDAIAAGAARGAAKAKPKFADLPADAQGANETEEQFLERMAATGNSAAIEAHQAAKAETTSASNTNTPKRARRSPKPEGGYPVSVKTQRCTKKLACDGEEKPASEFYRDRSRPSGLDCWCKACTKQHQANKKAEEAAAS